MTHACTLRGYIADGKTRLVVSGYDALTAKTAAQAGVEVLHLTGYGNALNVRRTIRTFEAAGAAGIHLEDQVHPKRCGHMAGERVVPAAEMVAKLKAACDARLDDDFLIVARTDARAVEGLDAALERAALYREAGADMLFVEAPRSKEEIVRIAEADLGPQLFNWAYDALTPHVPLSRLAQLGFPLVLYADVAQVVHRAFVGLEQWRELEERYTR